MTGVGVPNMTSDSSVAIIEPPQPSARLGPQAVQQDVDVVAVDAHVGAVQHLDVLAVDARAASAPSRFQSARRWSGARSTKPSSVLRLP